MRFHTDYITHSDINQVLISTGLRAEGVYADTSHHRSQSHDHAFEIRLRATSGKDRMGTTRRWPNGGSTGADTSYEKAATYVEWGIFMAALYELDAEAKWARVYKNRDDFHRATAYNFATGYNVAA